MSPCVLNYPSLVGVWTLDENVNELLDQSYDDVIKWKHFPRYWPFVRGIHRSPVNSSHKGQWRGDLMFSLICLWINGWVNNREAGDLRRYRAHYDVIVMTMVGLKEHFSPSVCPSVYLSVCHTVFTMFPSSYQHETFRTYYHWQEWCPCKSFMSEVKGQAHRDQNPN